MVLGLWFVAFLGNLKVVNHEAFAAQPFQWQHFCTALVFAWAYNEPLKALALIQAVFSGVSLLAWLALL